MGGQTYPKVFVVGCERSGTTWVRAILSGHPRVVTGRESHAYPIIHGPPSGTGPPARDDVLRTYDHDLEAQRPAGLHHWVDRSGMTALLARAIGTQKPSVDAAEDVIEGVFDTWFHGHGGAGSVLVEKTPGHLYYADRILRRFPEARVVEVLRDGRDVCVSMEHRARHRPWVPQTRTEQVARWVQAVSTARDLRSRPDLAGRWHVARYEALKEEPRREIGRLFAFLDLPADRDLVEAVAADTDFARLPYTGEGRHHRKGVVGDWRTELGEGDLALFRELAGDLLVHAGYEY